MGHHEQEKLLATNLSSSFRFDFNRLLASFFIKQTQDAQIFPGVSSGTLWKAEGGEIIDQVVCRRRRKPTARCGERIELSLIYGVGKLMPNSFARWHWPPEQASQFS